MKDLNSILNKSGVWVNTAKEYRETCANLICKHFGTPHANGLVLCRNIFDTIKDKVEISFFIFVTFILNKYLSRVNASANNFGLK